MFLGWMIGRKEERQKSLRKSYRAELVKAKPPRACPASQVLAVSQGVQGPPVCTCLEGSDLRVLRVEGFLPHRELWVYRVLQLHTHTQSNHYYSAYIFYIITIKNFINSTEKLSLY